MAHLGKAMVDSTTEVFGRIVQELLPTPAKSHYVYNLRDISKVFQGVLMVTPGNCSNRQTMARLWAHEVMRVFHDRLVSAEDKTYFTTMVHELLKQRFDVRETHDEIFIETRILFGRPGSADSFGTIDVEPPIRTEQKPPVVRVDCLEMTCSAIGAAAAGVV